MKLEEAIQTQNFVSEKQKATLYLMYTAYQIKSNVSAALKDFSLTPEQYNVLRILKGKHPLSMCVKDIAGRMIEKSSNVPRIADRLVAKKLVKRNQSKEDKRETVISLTGKGISVLQESSVKVNELSEKMHNLSNEDAIILNKLLEQFNKD